MGTVSWALPTALAAAALLATSAYAGGLAAVILDSLVIRVYDNAGVPANERARAVSRANTILARTDIAVEWIDCPARRSLARQESLSPVCATAPTSQELVIRLVNSPAGTGGVGHTALGYSLIDAETSSGTIGTVFIDRVQQLAGSVKLETATLLGRAIAHEIGHLILGSNQHSDAGIMREIWTVEQLLKNRARDWVFLPAESERLRQARLLASAGLPAARQRTRKESEPSTN
jgi:hypothetical protein